MRSASQRAAQAPKLGIIAGGGELPGRLEDACRTGGRDRFVIAFNGVGNVESVTPDAWVDIGRVGDAFALLHDAKCEEVVLAGPIRRPKLSALRLDKRGRSLLAKFARVWGRDDALLSLIVDELEEEGFRVVGADDVLGELLASEGPLGQSVPSEQALVDIELGVRVLAALGALDIAQAVIVQQGRVLGIEAAEGTDALIERCAPMQAEEGPQAVLVKLKKPEQERRVDLPAIGAATVERAASAGLAGIAIESGGTLVMDQNAVVESADRAGLFVVAITPNWPGSDNPGG